MINNNQLGREIVRRMVDDKLCDAVTAIRFYYNSTTYENINFENSDDVDELYARFKFEFLNGKTLCLR